MRSLEAQIIEINKLNLIEKRWTTLALKGQRQTFLCLWVNEPLTGCDRCKRERQSGAEREREREQSKKKQAGILVARLSAFCCLSISISVALCINLLSLAEMATTWHLVGVVFGVHSMQTLRCYAKANRQLCGVQWAWKPFESQNLQLQQKPKQKQKQFLLLLHCQVDLNIFGQQPCRVHLLFLFITFAYKPTNSRQAGKNLTYTYFCLGNVKLVMPKLLC